MTQLQAPPASDMQLAALKRLIGRIEDDLADPELTDEQKLQNIGKRVAGVLDGR